MRVVWSRRALDHLEAVQDYIAQGSPAAAYKIALTVQSVFWPCCRITR